MKALFSTIEIPGKKISKKNSVDGDVVDKFSKIKPNTTRINYDKMLIFGFELIRMSPLSAP